MHHFGEVLEDIIDSFTSWRMENKYHKCPAGLRRSDATAHENMPRIPESGMRSSSRNPDPFLTQLESRSRTLALLELEFVETTGNRSESRP